MISTSEITWRNYAVESFCAFFLSAFYFLLLLRAGQLTPIFMAIAIVAVTIIGKKHLLAFGNPIITVSQIALRTINWYAGLAIVSLQLCFGALAGVVIKAAYDTSRIKGIESFTKASWTGGIAEAVGGFLLVAGILAIIHDQKSNNQSSPIAIGVLIIGFISIIIPALMGSIGVANPAVAFALGLYGNIAYVIAPIIGGILGGIFYSVVVDEQSFRSLVK